MSKQTAVEWLVEQVNADCLNSTFIRKELIDQAKAMHKEQLENAYFTDNMNDEGSFVEYYNAIYGGDK